MLIERFRELCDIDYEKRLLVTDTDSFSSVFDFISVLKDAGFSVVDYNDDAISAYINGKKDVPFQDIAQVVLDEYQKDLTPKLKKELEDVVKNGVKKDSPIENTILGALDKFAEDAYIS